jgi:hypothetical protein
MPDIPQRFDWVSKTAKAATVLTLILLGVGAAATVAGTVWCMTTDKFVWPSLIVGVLAVFAEIVSAVCVVAGFGVVKLFVSTESAAFTIAGRLARLEALLESQAESIGRLTDLAGLSDQAKSCIYRDRELEAVREVIQEDLMRQDYQTASALVDNLEKRLGYADEAARLREEIAASRRATVDEKIDSAVRRIQYIIDRHDWASALRESQSLLRLFPDNPKISSLPEHIEAARTKHKRDLLQAYGEAVKKNDVDRSIELLRELDRYLMPPEAAALQDSARGVFRAKLHNLGVQFAINVTDRHWAKAVATGEEIIREFPNTRMAQEVRDNMDHLRARAAKKAQEAQGAAGDGPTSRP